MKLFLPFFAALAASAVVHSTSAAETFLKPNDVIALVGGEDMVVAGELGYLELLLQRSLPDYHLKVRSLAWEGDTVFEQPRMLNYPKLEQQLDEIGATVVIAQFGQMESMAGKARLPEFVAAYEKLITRLRGVHQSRRFLTLSVPILSEEAVRDERRAKNMRFLEASEFDRGAYTSAVRELADRVSAKFSDLGDMPIEHSVLRRDGVHLRSDAHSFTADVVARALGCPTPGLDRGSESQPVLLTLIERKNRLWDRYRRPQNWAFLAGDRTTQPSSRDHRDSSKRWFPEEMKEFIPLIEAREREIWTLAAKLAAEKN